MSTVCLFIHCLLVRRTFSKCKSKKGDYNYTYTDLIDELQREFTISAAMIFFVFNETPLQKRKLYCRFQHCIFSYNEL